MEQWETVEQIAAARRRFETENPGYCAPSAHGLIVDGEIAVWNVGEHLLPAAVLCSVLGHDGSTAARPVTDAQLVEAIDALAPAEACDFYDHPNLAAWRGARDGTVVAVFIDEGASERRAREAGSAPSDRPVESRTTGRTASVPEEEIPLEGGNLNQGIVRVGDTVRRTAGPWTPSVHALLEHLERVGYPAPRPSGLDGLGREVLSFIPGVAAHPEHLDALGTRDGVERAGRLIDDYHRAQVGFSAPRDAHWQDLGRDPSGSEEVLAHNDFSPWNLIIGPRWVFIDWDLVAPGRRAWDLAWALHSLVGLWPDSEHDEAETVARISAFCDGARVDVGRRASLLEVVVERTGHNASEIRRRSRDGDPAYRRMLELGHADRWEQGCEHVQLHLDRWAWLIERAP